VLGIICQVIVFSTSPNLPLAIIDGMHRLLLSIRFQKAFFIERFLSLCRNSSIKLFIKTVEFANQTRLLKCDR
jgi:hypothetical protein